MLVACLTFATGDVVSEKNAVLRPLTSCITYEVKLMGK